VGAGLAYGLEAVRPLCLWHKSAAAAAVAIKCHMLLPLPMLKQLKFYILVHNEQNTEKQKIYTCEQ